MKKKWSLGFSTAINLSSTSWKDGEWPEGFEYVELVAGYQPHEDARVREKCLQSYLADMEHATGQGLKVWSLHLPYGYDLDLTVEEEKSEEMFQNFAWYIDKTIFMKPKCYVVHVFTWEPLITPDRDVLLKRANRNIKRLASYIAGKGSVLAVESLPRTNLGNVSAECLKMISGTKAGICFDVNHMLIESHREFLEAAHPYIRTVHLSDYDFVDEKHWIPGDGDLNWRELADLLEAYGYDGPLMFEAKFRKDGSMASLKDIREGFYKAVERGETDLC